MTFLPAILLLAAAGLLTFPLVRGIGRALDAIGKDERTHG